MARFDGSPPPGSARGAEGSGGWDDWDPAQAHRGYTGHMRALRDLDLARDPTRNLPPPLLNQRATGAGTQNPLSSAALALSVRAETEDYLTVTYDRHEPGFVEYFDAIILPQWYVPFGRLLLSVFLTLPRNMGWQVLDVACATGYPTLELARFLGQGCDLAGIDTWDEGIQVARRKATDEWLSNVTFLTADITQSGLPDGSSDTITCNLGLETFADRAAALGAMWRLLRPRGQLLVTLPLQSAMREFLDTYHLTLRDLKLQDYMRSLRALVSGTPTIGAARQFVERAGFEVQRVVTDSFTLRFPDVRTFLTAPMVQTTYLAQWRALVPDLTVRRLVFNEVERRLQARAQASGGELLMTVPMACVSAIRV